MAKKKEDTPEVKPENKKRVYYSYHQKQGFKVPFLDENGKTVIKLRPGTNNPEIINGKVIPVMVDKNFSTQSNSIKKGCLSYYETDDPQEIEILDALSEDDSNEIMTEEKYLKNQDPKSFEVKAELKAEKEKNAALENEVKASKDIIAELNAKLAAFEGK